MNLTFPKRTLLVLTGPTAVGKTEFTISLAERMRTVIISADSRQMFREMSIGTARPSAEELNRVTHYFVGTLSIHDYYNVSLFEQQVLKLLETLFLQHDVVIMTGGSPQYIDAVCKGIDLLPDPDPATRQFVNNLYNQGGLEGLRAQLELLDPRYAAQVDLHDAKRMMRAIEVSLQMKKPYSACLGQPHAPRDFHIVRYYLNRSRAVLFDRINRRVDHMMEVGLLEEVRSLYPFRNLNALNTVGYKELFAYLDGSCSLEQAVTDIKTDTRRYAKRQLTWFKREYEEVMLTGQEKTYFPIE